MIDLAAAGLRCFSPAVAPGLRCLRACGILVPWPGVKPMSPALEGGLLTTRPPVKSLKIFFKPEKFFFFQKEITSESNLWRRKSGAPLLGVGTKLFPHGIFFVFLSSLLPRPRFHWIQLISGNNVIFLSQALCLFLGIQMQHSRGPFHPCSCLFFFWPHCAACGILAGTERSPQQWNSERVSPVMTFLCSLLPSGFSHSQGPTDMAPMASRACSHPGASAWIVLLPGTTLLFQSFAPTSLPLSLLKKSLFLILFGWDGS